MPSESPQDHPSQSSWSRRTFLQGSASLATGVAVTVVTPAAAAVALDRPSGTQSSTLARAVAAEPRFAVPAEPVTAYLRDARSGEVTVLSGTVERTYRDPVLAQRLLDAARAQDPNRTEDK